MNITFFKVKTNISEGWVVSQSPSFAEMSIRIENCGHKIESLIVADKKEMEQIEIRDILKHNSGINIFKF